MCIEWIRRCWRNLLTSLACYSAGLSCEERQPCTRNAIALIIPCPPWPTHFCPTFRPGRANASCEMSSEPSKFAGAGQRMWPKCGSSVESQRVSAWSPCILHREPCSLLESRRSSSRLFRIRCTVAPSPGVLRGKLLSLLPPSSDKQVSAARAEHS